MEGTLVPLEKCLVSVQTFTLSGSHLFQVWVSLFGPSSVGVLGVSRKVRK